MEDRHTVLPNFAIRGSDPALPRQARLCAALLLLRAAAAAAAPSLAGR